MKKNLRYLAIAAVGAVAALGFSSCAYDPYYSGASVGGSYSTGGGGGGAGYGDGYGYGGSSFSTSFFVGTGDPRWGYDPYNYSYYDYTRRCYYDPYLHGYYPMGYRPPVVYGVPHPHGWSHGHGHIRPPSHVTNVTVVNYRNRDAAYRNTNYGWARQVRQGPVGAARVQGQRPQQGSYDRRNPQNYNTRSNTGSYRPNSDTYNRSPHTYDRSSRYQNTQPSRQQRPEPAPRQENYGRPSRYNTPVNDQRAQTRQEQRATQPRENRRYEERRANPNKQKYKDGKNEKDDDRGRAYR